MPTKQTQNNITARPPIVVVLGHVDHGKSTLLDYIRKTNTTDKEAGGITQHISAYEVVHKTSEGKEKRITFLDTPGHKAFAKMRERGANLADIAILVVSGEDGVKEQTIEVLKTLQESKIPYIVAISKIDKPNVSIEKIKQDLAEHEVLVEGYGGNVPMVPISAKTGAGVPELLDMILLVAELEELKGDTSALAEGVVVESHIDPQRGISATIIITNGTLKKGMRVAVDDVCAPIRKIDTFLDHNATEAIFSSPVILTGFNNMPKVGTTMYSFESKKDAETYIKKHRGEIPKLTVARGKMAEKIISGEIISVTKEFFVPIVIKADTTGSLEALEHEITGLSREDGQFKIIHKGVGTIEEGDIKAAAGGKNIIIVGLHVDISKTAQRIAAQQDTIIKTFDIIYKLTEWLAEEIKKRIPKITVEEQTGSAKIIKIFSKIKNKQVIGGKVTDGEIAARGKIKIMRRGQEISRGEILELQQQKIKVGRVVKGAEFGALIESKYDIAPGDTIEAFMLVEK